MKNLKPKKNKFKSNKFSAEKKDVETVNFESKSMVIENKEKILISMDKVNDLFNFPASKQQVRIITKKTINTFDLIRSIINEFGRVEKLYIVSYRIGKGSISEIHELQKVGKIDDILMVMSGGLRRMMPDVHHMLESLKSDKFILKEAEAHAKIYLLKTESDFFVIEGSGNLSHNAKIEQFTIDNDELIYNFHKTWIDNL